MNTNYKQSDRMVIYTKRLAGYLLLNGFDLISVRPDIENPLSKVYLFNKTDRLLQAIEDYKIQNN